MNDEKGHELKEEPEEGKKTVWRELWDFAKVIWLALLIALPIRYFVAQPFIVKGQSMVPSFADSQYLIIDELTYQFREPKRGEVIVFRNPRNTSDFFIKRIIGLPGEKVVIENGTIKIANLKENKEFVLHESYLSPSLKTFPNETLEPGKDQYVVLGDNRMNSSDSRVWGLLDRKLITGRALFRAWPPSKFGIIPEPSY